MNGLPGVKRLVTDSSSPAPNARFVHVEMGDLSRASDSPAIRPRPIPALPGPAARVLATSTASRRQPDGLGDPGAG